MHCDFDIFNHHFCLLVFNKEEFIIKLGVLWYWREFFVCVHFWCQLELHVCGDSVYLLVWDLVLSHFSIYVVRIISWNMLQISCVGDLEMFRSVCHCLLVCLFVCLFFCYFKAIFFSIFMDTTYQSFRKFCVPSELLDLLEHFIYFFGKHVSVKCYLVIVLPCLSSGSCNWSDLSFGNCWSLCIVQTKWVSVLAGCWVDEPIIVIVLSGYWNNNNWPLAVTN